MERGTDRIRLESSAHGQYECRAEDFDKIMAEYEFFTLTELQREIEEREGYSADSYRITSRTEAYMILAELRGFATN